MNYAALIQNRKSVREFSGREVSFDQLEMIKKYYVESAKALDTSLKTELYVFGPGTGPALEGAAGYNQFLVGAPQYLVLLSEQGELAGLNSGFLMEDLVLKLTDMDLNTCWVTFADGEEVKEVLGIESALDVAAIVAFGYGVKTTKRLRLNLRSMSDVDIVAKHRYMEPKRSVADMAFVNTWGNAQDLDRYIGFFDEVLWEALYAASLAPSYLNRQAYGFILHEGQISLVSRPDGYNTKTDGELSLGIVLHHFTSVAENWAGKIRWQFGEEAAKLELPEGHAVIATCAM